MLERRVILSSSEPDRNSLWLHTKDNKFILESYTSRGWEPIGVSSSSKDDMPTFKASMDPKDLAHNLDTMSKIDPNDCVIVSLIGTIEGIDYNIRGTYCNRYITTVAEHSVLIFEVRKDDGIILLYSKYNLSLTMPTIDLEIGDSGEVKRHNLSKLTLGHFLTAIDYGFGVGTFSPSTGGFAHITTAYGNDVFYDIAVDGSVTANTTYVKPSAPYTVILEADKIGTTLDAVTASQVQEAGELIVRGSTGLITYTRTSDSTNTVIYFTDDRKDGKTTILTYNVGSRVITSAMVSPAVSPATTSTIGGVKMATSIADLVIESANAEIIAGKVNDLLNSLRAAGIIES